MLGSHAWLSRLAVGYTAVATRTCLVVSTTGSMELEPCLSTLVSTGVSSFILWPIRAVLSKLLEVGDLECRLLRGLSLAEVWIAVTAWALHFSCCMCRSRSTATTSSTGEQQQFLELSICSKLESNLEPHPKCTSCVSSGWSMPDSTPMAFSHNSGCVWFAMSCFVLWLSCGDAASVVRRGVQHWVLHSTECLQCGTLCSCDLMHLDSRMAVCGGINKKH